VLQIPIRDCAYSGRRSRRLFRSLPIVLLTALLACSAHALDPSRQITQYIQSSWNGDSGLPQNSVHAVAQTADGFLWFGTEEGLVRFDGVHFQVYNREDFAGLASDYVTALAAAPDGSLWIGTDSGLSRFTPAQPGSSAGQFQILAASGLAGSRITALCPGHDGSLWVGAVRGLYRVVKDRIENWTVGRGLPDAAVTDLARDASGTLWVGTAKGLARLRDSRFVTLTTRDGLPGDNIAALAPAPDGSLWIGTVAHGLAQLRQGRIVQPFPVLPWKQIYALLSDRDGALWIAFDRHGIGRLYRGHLDLYGAANGLPSNRCTHALFEDREGSLWIGLLDAGVVQLRAARFAVFGKPEGLSGSYVGNILQARDGSMWIGADSNGLNHLLPDGAVQVWDHRRGLPNSAVFSLLQTADGALWVGYRNGSLARILNGQVSLYHDPHAPSSSLNALFQDRQGQLWLGFYGRGLARFDHGLFHHLDLTGRVDDIVQSPDGALWVATDGSGVERIVADAVTRLTTANGLPSNHVMCLYADPDGSIWAGTASGGLSRIRGGPITSPIISPIVSWTPKQGLPTPTVGSILEDGSGNLWIGGDDGIFRLSRAGLDFTATHPGARLHPVAYGTADGLRSRETLYGSMPCAWRDRQGRLWFATIQGAAVIDPAHIPTDRVVPPVWIDRVVYNSREVPFHNGLNLGPGAGNFEINFTAPSFIDPGRMRFRYRLDGFDTAWTNAGSRRSAWYTNVPPGRYTFQVLARNSDGVWNTNGASFSFTLQPPLSRTPLTYAAYALLTVLLVWGVIALRTRQLTLHEQQLTRTVAERTAQLESEKQALEEARHELQFRATHDSLTGLFNRAAMLEHLQREIARATREKTILAVLIADLDHFKQLNDRYGHLCGDDLIREAAARLNGATREYDVVGRYGGEEFLILLPGFDLRQHPARVDELLDSIRSRPFMAEDAEVRLTCSIGVGTFRPQLDSPDTRDVLCRADAALYVAKNSGRNRACFEARDTADPSESRDLAPAPSQRRD